jgi:hypothetical protein
MTADLLLRIGLGLEGFGLAGMLVCAFIREIRRGR